jgi:hypothetical protein
MTINVKTNQSFYGKYLYSSANSIRKLKPMKMMWMGHLERIGEMRKMHQYFYSENPTEGSLKKYVHI